MPYAIFASIGALQLLNLFWYYLMCRILVRYAGLEDVHMCNELLNNLSRAIITSKADDDRSDDEDDGEDEKKEN